MQDTVGMCVGYFKLVIMCVFCFWKNIAKKKKKNESRKQEVAENLKIKESRTGYMLKITQLGKKCFQTLSRKTW